MLKWFIYVWIVLFSTIAIYIIASTPSDISRDAITNEYRFKTAISFIDSFKLICKRLPLKSEFNSWQQTTTYSYAYQNANVCNDSLEDPYPESLTYHYLRVKQDFNYDSRYFKLQHVDFCKDYALTKWDGDDWIYYMSWNKNYSNHFSWLQSITLFIFYMLVGLLPLLWRKFQARKKTAPNNRIQAIGAGR